jgi:hypothetical protein
MVRSAYSHWGPHFGPDGSSSHWGPHFPEYSTPQQAPHGVATILLEQAASVTYSWKTDVHKSSNGKERRISIWDAPRIRLDGTAYLLGADSREQRSRLARFAALGSAFNLALPFEEVTLSADATGATLHVNSTAYLDWCLPGTPVVVISPSGEIGEDVVQSSTANTIVVATSLGSIARAGGRVMPAIAVYLDPQQGFSRYQTTVERWQISAQCARGGFRSSAVAAQFSLAAPRTTGGALEGVVLVARTPGEDGNNIIVTQVGNAGISIGGIIEDVENHQLGIAYQGDVTTVAQYVALLAESQLVGISGTYDPTDILAAVDDEFGGVPMSGGANESLGDMGVGATVNEYDDRPVYDRGLQLRDTAGDSLQSMAEVIEISGVLSAAGGGSISDWGRHVLMEGSNRADWQWIKAFLWEVRGRQRAFWLPTWRPDLVAISAGTLELVINAGVEYGDLFAWWPTQRDRLQIVQADGTITHVQISAATDNGDGTITLTIDATLSGSAIAMVSWLELCRMESDDFTVSFSEGIRFSMQTSARVVQQ